MSFVTVIVFLCLFVFAAKVLTWIVDDGVELCEESIILWVITLPIRIVVGMIRMIYKDLTRAVRSVRSLVQH
jgi:hypothetical protein